MANKKYQKSELYNQETVDNISGYYKAIIEDLGENSTREGLIKTPERAAKAMHYLTQGYDQDAEAVLQPPRARRRVEKRQPDEGRVLYQSREPTQAGPLTGRHLSPHGRSQPPPLLWP